MKIVKDQELEKDTLRVLARNSLWALRVAWSACPRLVATRAVTVLVRSLLPAVIVFGVKQIVDGLSNAAETSSAIAWLVILPLVLLLNSVLDSVASFIQVRISDELNISINVGMLRHAANLDLAFFEDPSRQDMLARTQQNSALHCEALVREVIQFARNSIQIVTVLVVATLIEPLIAPMIFGLALPFCLIQIHLAKSQYWVEHHRASKIRWTRYFLSKLTNHTWIPEIKLLNLAPLLLEKFQRLLSEFRDQNRAIQLRRMVVNLCFGVVFSIGVCLLVYRIFVRAQDGTETFGSVAALLLAAERLFTSISGYVSLLGKSVHSAMMVSNLRNFHSTAVKVSSNGSTVPKPRGGEVEFHNVSFAYPGSKRPVLENISFTIRPGEVVALVGRNGAGKTTLVKLLGGLYSPDGGTIRFDGCDLRDLSQDVVQSRMSFVMQSFGRYEATAAENIAYGNWQRLRDDPEAIRHIAQQAGVHEMIEQLPDGYDTFLGRTFGHITLSGGQWRALALARALARDASLTVLDEPTASVDPKREYDLFVRFREIICGQTALIISHRFSTVRMADRILVLDEGRLVENGTHDELVVSGGMYAQMYKLYRRILEGSVACGAP